MSTLTVLDDDPFHLAPARVRNANWFAELWQRLGRPGLHVHGLHYVLVSQADPVRLPFERRGAGSDAYENTEGCDKFLRDAGRDARYLGLIPAGSIVDRRNDEPITSESVEAADASVFVSGGARAAHDVGFDVPRLVICPPTIPQRYRIEIWIEKSSMQHLLQPLHDRFGVSIQQFGGDASLTKCEDFIERAAADGRPTRVLYVSDFDPAGHNMPVATARKIQFLLYQQDLDLDIQVRPVVLTHEQCVEYRLPRTPLKGTERRALGFEQRFGEGGTELDALEALHPGELTRILIEEIERYRDPDLYANIREAESEARAELDAINKRVAAVHRKAVLALTAELNKVKAAVAASGKRAAKVTDKITRALRAESPDADDFNWPEPAEGDEDLAPLFDSTRDFIEQTDEFKLYQGKNIERAERQLGSYPCTCIACGKTFTAVRRTARYCNNPCRKPHDPNRSHKRKDSTTRDH